MARYLVEPKNQAQVSHNENNNLPQKEIVAQLKDLIGHYSVFSDANQAKKLTEQLIKIFSKCKETLRDTL